MPKSAHSCRHCARWLEGEWPDTNASGRAELQRQMDYGLCDACAVGYFRATLRRAMGDAGRIGTAEDYIWRAGYRDAIRNLAHELGVDLND